MEESKGVTEVFKSNMQEYDELSSCRSMKFGTQFLKRCTQLPYRMARS